MSKQASRPRRAGRPNRAAGRDQLLDVALAVFADVGYAGASMGDIAERAGLRKASLFHHFENKDALYREVVSRLLGKFSLLIAVARLGEGDFADRLDRLGRLVVEYLASHPDAARVMLRELLEDRRADWPWRDAVQAALAMVTGFLEAGMTAGRFAKQDARQLALSIVGLHLLYFGSSEVSGRLCGRDPFSPAAAEARAQAILGQVRALCGVDPTAGAARAPTKPPPRPTRRR
jgi:AcrR family transcriptional regulator